MRDHHRDLDGVEHWRAKAALNSEPDPLRAWGFLTERRAVSPNAHLAAGRCMSASLTLGAVFYGLQLAIEAPK